MQSAGPHLRRPAAPLATVSPMHRTALNLEPECPRPSRLERRSTQPVIWTTRAAARLRTAEELMNRSKFSWIPLDYLISPRNIDVACAAFRRAHANGSRALRPI